MTVEQITDLAREYIKCCGYGLQINPYTVEEVICFLLHRYLLVEKEAVMRMYQDAKKRYFNPDDEVEKAMYGGRMSLLEYLFPDITKDAEK